MEQTRVWRYIIGARNNKLEDVDYNGASTMHGPEKAKVKAPYRAKGKKQK